MAVVLVLGRVTLKLPSGSTRLLSDAYEMLSVSGRKRL